MRATSVIFLILSVILAMIGVMTCAIGANLAEEEGIALFDQVADAENNLVYTYNYTGDGIKKIAIDVGTAEVHIYGGSDSAYIEMINFPKSAYDLSSSNMTLSVVDNSSLLKILSLGTDGLNFHGFRHYLKAFNFADKQRVINIYVTEDSAIKQFDLTLETGSLYMQDIRHTFDLTAELKEGNVHLSNLATSSDLTLRLESGSLQTEAISTRSLTIEAGLADLELKQTYFARGLNIRVVEGDVAFDTLLSNFSGYITDLQAPQGEIDFFGMPCDSAYTDADNDDEAYTVSIMALKGDITVTHTPSPDEAGE